MNTKFLKANVPQKNIKQNINEENKVENVRTKVWDKPWLLKFE